MLDIAHRRQVAQEGLSESAAGSGAVERTWSFATEGTHSEFATVPEEVAEAEEVEMADLTAQLVAEQPRRH